MMRVFDASAVLALIFGEAGADKAAALVADGDGAISSVNLAEVASRLLDTGYSPRDVDATCAGLRLQVLPFTVEDSLAAGHLRTETRSLGLSLGDRCCLAVARAHAKAHVVTADRPWKALKGFRVTLIR